MSTRKTVQNVDAETNQILDGLTGDFRLGQKYYFFTVTYHYIGAIQSVSPDVIVLEPGSTIVNKAGSENDAVSQIVAGKRKPEIAETPGTAIRILRQSLTAVIDMK